MPSFPSLPRELRQRILKFAFDDAAEADCTLNGMLENECFQLRAIDKPSPSCRIWRKSYSTSIKSCITIVNEKIVENTQETAWPLDVSFSEDEEFDKVRLLDKIHQYETEFMPHDYQIYAPRIHELATKIISACPGLADDVSYMLNKALSYLELIYAEEKKAIEVERMNRSWSDITTLPYGRFGGRTGVFGGDGGVTIGFDDLVWKRTAYWLEREPFQSRDWRRLHQN